MNFSAYKKDVNGMILIYDNTFEGFLSTVFDAYTLKNEPLDIVSAACDMQMGFGDVYHHVETTVEKADRLMAGLCKLGIADTVVFAFLSYMIGRELAIYRYIALAFKVKDDLKLMHANDIVRKVKDMHSQAEHEKMRWKGYLRFSVMENDVFYAEMTPKNNVLTLIMPHFSRRFNTKPFLIHDLIYKQVGLYDTKEWFIMSSEGISLPAVHADEQSYRYLWKLFYDTTAMESRMNEKRRREVIPKRYRAQMVEL